MIQINHILVLSQRPFLDSQVRSGLAPRGGRLGRLVGRLRGLA